MVTFWSPKEKILHFGIRISLKLQIAWLRCTAKVKNFGFLLLMGLLQNSSKMDTFLLKERIEQYSDETFFVSNELGIPFIFRMDGYTV